VEEFQTKGPFTANIPTAEALASVAGIRAQLNALKEQELQLRRGLGIFKIDQPPSKEIGKLEQVHHPIHRPSIYIGFVFEYAVFHSLERIGCDKRDFRV
jgi:hypothetical protein